MTDQTSQAGADTAPLQGEDRGDPPKIEFSASNGFGSRLARLGVSLAFTSYQSGGLYLLGHNPDGTTNVHQARMPRPMGLCWAGDGALVMSAGTEILTLCNVLEPHERANDRFDTCFVVRRSQITGSLDAHDIGLLADQRPVFVNTRYNCLATPHATHSFEPFWRPPFITDLVDEDRCHLNGLAMNNGEPAYVTAVSRSNTIDGWRDRRADGGIVIAVGTGDIVCEGLSMPHSPRLHNGKLWIANSGTGELGWIDPDAGVFEPVCFCPGFVRGLSMIGDHAFIGLSKPRYKRFEGLDLDHRLTEADSEPWCGIQIIDLTSGTCVDWFRIDGAVAELYDVAALPGMGLPMAIAPGTADAASLITYRDTAPHSG